MNGILWRLQGLVERLVLHAGLQIDKIEILLQEVAPMSFDRLFVTIPRSFANLLPTSR
jgi:hypothetical protein